MKVSFIVVLYKTPKKEVERIREEIKSFALKNYKLLFIDNTRINRGYAGAINKGIKLSKKYNPDVYVIANDDISLKNINCDELFEASEYFDIWGFSLKQFKEMRYGGEIDKFRLSGGLISKKPNKRFVPVDFVSGSLMFIKKDVIKKIGLLDESYFLYYEEVDYCTRAKQQGFKIGIDSKLVYEHYEVSGRNDLKEFYLKKNRLKYLLKYGSFKQKIYEVIRAPKTFIENKNSTSFNFISLNLSSFINRVLNFFLFLILLRVLAVENYGIYTLVWAHINIFSPIADFGTTTYGIVKLPVDSKDKYNHFYSLRFVAGIFAVVTTILAAFLLKLNYLLISFIILTSPIIISNAISGSYLIILSLKNKQYLSSVVSVVFNIILLLVLSLVLFITKSITFLFVSIALLYIGYAFINYFLSRKEFPDFTFKFQYSIWRTIAEKSFVYVLISLFAGLYFRLDLYLLNFLKNSEAVGIYSAGYKFFEAFIFIAGSYSLSTLPTLTKLYKSSKKIFIWKVKRDLLLMAILGFAISFASFMVAPYVLPIFLNNSYLPSVAVFRIVIFALPAIFATTVLLNFLYILKRAYIVVYIFIGQTIINFALNYAFIPKYSFFASSYITLFGEILTLLISMILFIKYLKYENRY